MSLLNPRRLIIAHHPSGKSDVVDAALPLYPLPNGLSANAGYVQRSFMCKPEEGITGGQISPDRGGFQSSGVALFYIDIPPGKSTGMHFTNTIDYIILTHGQLVISTHDGITKELSVGDVVVQVANAHSWENKTDKPARMVAITLPSEATKVEGKGLDEALGVFHLGAAPDPHVQ